MANERSPRVAVEGFFFCLLVFLLLVVLGSCSSLVLCLSSSWVEAMIREGLFWENIDLRWLFKGVIRVEFCFFLFV